MQVCSHLWPLLFGIANDGHAFPVFPVMAKREDSASPVEAMQADQGLGEGFATIAAIGRTWERKIYSEVDHHNDSPPNSAVNSTPK